MAFSRSTFALRLGSAPAALTFLCFLLAFADWAAAAAEAPSDRSQSLLSRAREALAGHRTISAKIHQRIHLYGQELVGGGIFVQGPPERNLLQLDLKIKVAGQVSYVQQRCDGTFFWVQKVVEGVPVLTRIDIRRVEAARAEFGRRAAGDAHARRRQGKSSLPMLGLGGMAHLLDQLSAWCTFTRIGEGRLPGPEKTPVLVLEGTWRPEQMRRWLPEPRAAADTELSLNVGKLPPMMPDRIMISLGRDDLFPRRIEYTVSESRRRSQGEASPLVQIHFEDVQFDAAVDPRQFQFESRVATPIDDTDGYLLRQGWTRPSAP